MKMKRDHIVPLSKQSVEILTELKAINKTGNVFPSMQGHAATMSNNTILNAIWSLGYKGKMTGHGFRSLAMTTILEEINGRYEVVDRQLAHAPKSEIDAAYNRSIYLQERTVMMQNWADYLDRASGKTDEVNNVLPFVTVY